MVPFICVNEISSACPIPCLSIRTSTSVFGNGIARAVGAGKGRTFPTASPGQSAAANPDAIPARLRDWQDNVVSRYRSARLSHETC